MGQVLLKGGADFNKGSRRGATPAFDLELESPLSRLECVAQPHTCPNR